MKTALFTVALTMSASIACAQDGSGYAFHIPELRDQDNACKAEALSTLQDSFDGVERVNVDMPSYWDSNIPGLRIFAYNDAEVVAAQGTVRSQVQCLIFLPANQIVEVAFQFADGGLQGNKRLPKLNVGPPIASQSFVAQTKTFITGAN